MTEQTKLWKSREIKESSELLKYVGEVTEYTPFKYSLPETLILNPSSFVYLCNNLKNLWKVIYKVENSIITPSSKFFMASGSAYGDLIQKNYYRYMAKKGLPYGEVKTERNIESNFSTPDKLKKILFKGRADILDHEQRQLIEIKTSDVNGYTEQKLERAFKQSILYKVGLCQEIVGIDNDKKARDYAGYTIKVLTYDKNLSLEQSSHFTEHLLSQEGEKTFLLELCKAIYYVGKRINPLRLVVKSMDIREGKNVTTERWYQWEKDKKIKDKDKLSPESEKDFWSWMREQKIYLKGWE